VTFGISGSVRGANELEALAKACKATGDGQLRKDLLAGIRKAAKPVADSIKETMRDELPHGGGLNEWAASAKIAPRTRTSGKNAGVRITGTKSGHDFEAINEGTIRHPVWDKGGWAEQSIPSGTWDRGGEKAASKVVSALDAVLDETAARIARSV
jgi:hypothetical protein